MTDDLSTLSDREVLLSGRATIVAANRVHAQRLQCLAEFYRRRFRDEKARVAADPHFALTARQETVVEAGELWGLSAPLLRSMLNNALFLIDHLPGIWDLVTAGQLDDYRTRLAVEGCRLRLGPEAAARYDERMATWLRKHLRGVEGEPDLPRIVTCTSRQLQNSISYIQHKLRPIDAEKQHRQALADRRVGARVEEHGMGSLWISNTIDKVKVADRHLTLAAKQRKAAGDERTIQQLRADIALDLLAGKGAGVRTPAFARPVVNLTVPIQTVMGLSDDPGRLAGGTVIPATLARAIAADPDSTWHRMLVDPAGQMVELSTKSYQPTAPIVRHVVAEQGTCYRSGCDTAADECELDHRVPFPQGPTSTDNLAPACKTDHKAKHAPGFGLVQQPDGAWVLTTPTGFRHPVTRYLQPVNDRFPDIPVQEEDFQFSAAEIADALGWLRHERDRLLLSASDLWEDDPDHPAFDTHREDLRNFYEDHEDDAA